MAITQGLKNYEARSIKGRSVATVIQRTQDITDVANVLYKGTPVVTTSGNRVKKVSVTASGVISDTALYGFVAGNVIDDSLVTLGGFAQAPPLTDVNQRIGNARARVYGVHPDTGDTFYPGSVASGVNVTPSLIGTACNLKLEGTDTFVVAPTETLNPLIEIVDIYQADINILGGRVLFKVDTGKGSFPNE